MFCKKERLGRRMGWEPGETVLKGESAEGVGQVWQLIGRGGRRSGGRPWHEETEYRRGSPGIRRENVVNPQKFAWIFTVCCHLVSDIRPPRPRELARRVPCQRDVPVARRSRGLRRGSSRILGECPRMPDAVQKPLAASVDPRNFRAVARPAGWLAGRSTLRTFMSTHFPFKISYTPNYANPLAIVRSARHDRRLSLRGHLGVARSRVDTTRGKHQSSNKKFVVRIFSVKPNPTRLTNVTSR